MTRLFIAFFVILLPKIASAQSIDVGGTVASQVDANESTVVASPTTLPANGVAITQITVTLRNAGGTTLPNITVVLTSNRGATDFVGHYVGTTLTVGNSYTSDASGVVKFGSRSSTVGNAIYTAVAEAQVTLTNKPVVTFTAPPSGGGGDDKPPPPGDEPPPGGGGTTPPTTEPPSAVEKVINFLKERVNDTTSGTLAGLGALTTIAIFPTLTTSIVTALLQNIPFLNFIFTSWLPIRKRRYWGTVRDKKTGVPIAGVEVLLFRAGGSESLMKYRTDQTGQYGFLVEQPGDYFIAINNPLYLAYRSLPFTVSRPAQLVNLDIPLLANVAEQIKQVGKARRYLDWVYYLNYISVILVSVGTVVSIYVFYSEPSTVSGIALGLYAIIWSVKLIYYLKYRYYGSVVAQPNNTTLPSAIVQLTGERQGIQALVHSTISDSRGRFLFIVKPAKYSMIVAKEGFEPTEAEVDEKRLVQTIKLQPSINNEILRPIVSPIS